MKTLPALIRNVLKLPENFQVFVCADRPGSTNEILGLLDFGPHPRAAFLDSGSRSAASIRRAREFFQVEIVGSSRESAYSYVPKQIWMPYDIAFLHLTSNNELEGNRVVKFPKMSVPLVCDKSADLFLAATDFEDFGIVYAEGGCGIVPVGLNILIVHEKYITMINQSLEKRRHFLAGSNYADKESLINLGSFYNRLLKLQQLGGIESLQSGASGKSEIFYREIDRNKKFAAVVNCTDRSPQFVRFKTLNQRDMYPFSQALDVAGLNMLRITPYGDFVLHVHECGDAQVEKFIVLMQKFEACSGIVSKTG